jgi:F0F1-type ATP synthase membrane subunit b/b'
MNTLLWLTAGILAQAETPVIPPDPPAVVSAGGGQRRKQFVVSGKRGRVTLTDPRLISLFQRILNGEEPTEFEITHELTPIAPDYGVSLTNNIQVLTDILDKLESAQYNVVKQKERKELESAIAEVLSHREDLKAFMAQGRAEAQRVVREAQEELDAHHEALEAEAKENLRNIDKGFIALLDAELLKAQKEMINLLVKDLSKTESTRRTERKIQAWTATEEV